MADGPALRSIPLIAGLLALSSCRMEKALEDSEAQSVAGLARSGQQLGAQVSKIRSLVCAPGDYIESEITKLGGPAAIVDTLKKAAEGSGNEVAKDALNEAAKLLDLRMLIQMKVLETLVQTKSLNLAFKSLAKGALTFPATMSAKASAVMANGGAAGAATQAVLWAGAYWGACKTLMLVSVTGDLGMQTIINQSEKARLDDLLDEKCKLFQDNPHIVMGAWPDWCPKVSSTDTRIVRNGSRTIAVPKCESMKIRDDLPGAVQSYSSEWLAQAEGKIGSGIPVYRQRTVLHPNGVAAMKVKVQKGGMSGREVWVNASHLEVRPEACK